jgi:endogenous inhibitor of DNA gyrase (YacG/DUF329 family)
MTRPQQIEYIEGAESKNDQLGLSFYEIKLNYLMERIKKRDYFQLSIDILKNCNAESAGDNLVKRINDEANDYLITIIDWSALKDCPRCHKLSDGYEDTEFCSEDCKEVWEAENLVVEIDRGDPKGDRSAIAYQCTKCQRWFDFKSEGGMIDSEGCFCSTCADEELHKTLDNFLNNKADHAEEGG